MRVASGLEQAWRHGATFEVTCTAHRGGVRLPVELDVLAGGVSMTDQPGVRARLAVSLRSAFGLWDALAPYGTVLRPVLTTRAGTSTWSTPFGSFAVDEQALTYDGAGSLDLAAPDLWSRVSTRRLDRSVNPRGNAVALAVQYAREALGADVTGQVVAAAPNTVWGQVYELERDEMVRDLLDAGGRVAWVDRWDRLVVARPPTLSGVPVWEVDAARDGVLVGAVRSRSSGPVRNRVIVRSPSARFPQVIVDDVDPASPTRVSGPMGPRPYFVSNPVLRSVAQAQVAGRDRLRRTTGVGADMTITAAPHWGLDPGDLLQVTLPGQNGDGWVSERHIVAEVNHPFPQRGSAVTQSIKTVSTRPDGGTDDDEGAA